MLVSAINNDRVATVRCAVTDSSKNVTYKNYFVTLGQDTTEQQAKQDASSLVKAAFPGATSVFANGETDNANGVTVNIDFYDNTAAHTRLDYMITHKFNENTPFDWFVKLNDDLGNIISVDWDKKEYPEDIFKATTQTPTGFETGVYVEAPGKRDATGTGTGFPAGTEITVKAYFAIDQYKYDLAAQYETLDGKGFDNATYEREGQLGLSIPTDSDLQFLRDGGKDHEHNDGWIVYKATDASVTAGVTSTVTVELHRAYHILQFNCEDGLNGPAAVFIKNGDTFTSISG